MSGPSIVAVIGNPKADSKTAVVATALAQYIGAQLPGSTHTTIECAALGAGLLEWGAPTVRTALEAMTSADLLIVATPTYKATYTGLLKLLLDQLGQGELAGAPTIPVQLAAAPAHALAVDVHLRPVLLEVGASCPTQSLFVLDATVDRLSDHLGGWATVNLPIVLACIAARMQAAA